MQTNVKVEFNLFSDYLDIPKITELMGISPTVTYIKGEPIKNGSPIKRKNALWGIWTEYEETWDIDTVLDKVVHMLKNKANIIVKIKEMYNAGISFVVVIKIVDDDHSAMSLSSETIQFIASLGARVDFCVYVY